MRKHTSVSGSAAASLLRWALAAVLAATAGLSAAAQQTGADKTIRVWDLEDAGELDLDFKGRDTLNAIAFSVDGKRLVGGGGSGDVSVWDTSDGDLITVLTGHTQSVETLAFNPGGDVLASGGFDRSVRLWSAKKWTPLRTFQWQQAVLAVAFSPDGRLLAIGGENGAVSIMDVATGTEVMAGRLEDANDVVTSLAFKPDGGVLAIGSRNSSVILWDVRMRVRKPPVKLSGHRDVVESIAFAPGGNVLATASRDQTAKLWDLETGKELLTLSGHASAVNVVSFSPDGKQLATGSYDRTIKIWEVATGKELKTLTGHDQPVTSVAFSPDGKSLVSSSALSRAQNPIMYILSVGIGEYRQLPPLRSSNRDAVEATRALEKVAANTFQRVNTSILRDPTRQEIIQAFLKLSEQVKPQDTFVFFYAGSGYEMIVGDPATGKKEFLLLPVDADPRRLLETSIPASALSTLFLKIEAQRQLILLDSSFASSGFDALSDRVRKESVGLEGLLRRDLVLLTTGMSMDGQAQGHGTLTQAFLKGVTGGAATPSGDVTAQGLSAYLKRALAGRLSGAKFNAEFKAFELGEDFKLGSVRAGGLYDKSRAAQASFAAAAAPPLGPVLKFGLPFGWGADVSGRGGLLPAWPAPPQTAAPQEPTRTRSDAIDENAPPAPLPRNGKDYALLIAVDEYDYWGDLKNPVFDAETLANELRENYGFETEVLPNPTKAQFTATLRKYIVEKTYSNDDQLFIFFAGHGWFDELFKEGYLVMRDSLARNPDDSTYISHTWLSRAVDAIPCKHIFLVLDSCFSGTFNQQIARRGEVEPYKDATNLQFIRHKMQYRTRRSLTSGGKEYVIDGIPKQHSPFARKLLSALREYGGRDGLITITGILAHIERVQPPPYEGEFGTHEPGGDFIFEAKKRAPGNQ